MADELDALAGLENRVQQAVDLVRELRQDNQELRGKLESANSVRAEAEKAVAELAGLREELSRANAEIETLRKERRTVRSRVEKILEQIDALSAG
jgi:uncharacterized coiled-coil DUF342 family protein